MDKSGLILNCLAGERLLWKGRKTNCYPLVNPIEEIIPCLDLEGPDGCFKT